MVDTDSGYVWFSEPVAETTAVTLLRHTFRKSLLMMAWIPGSSPTFILLSFFFVI